MEIIRTAIKCLMVGLVAGTLFSCDDKIRELQDLSQPPTFLYYRSASTNWETPVPNQPLIDSAKVWTANNNASYPILIKVGEPQKNFASLTITGSEPKSSIFVNDNLYTNNFRVTTNQDYNLAFRSPVASVQDFKLVSEEIFDRTNEMVVRIQFKENRPPIARLKMILTDGAMRDYQLNASGSFDIDKAIGGAVVQYEFTIDNIIIKTSENTINHIFKAGTHSVRVRVMDNDQVWSDYITQSITVS